MPERISLFMRQTQDPEEFYSNLREQLVESSDWPNTYLYKFIVPSSEDKVSKIEDIFEGMHADISTKSSSKGKYTSVSIRLKMQSPDHIIKKYKEVGKRVEGVISL